MGEFALFADRDETCRDLMRNRTAEDEPARLDARDLVDLHAGPRLHQFVDRAPKSTGVAQQCCDVPEHDAGLRIVRNRPDCRA